MSISSDPFENDSRDLLQSLPNQIYVNNIPLDIDFVKAAIQTTSKGLLRKFTGIIDGKLYYVKTGKRNSFGEYSPVQPIIEVIVSKMGREMGFNCIPYELSGITKGKKGFIEDTIVCISKSFLSVDETLIPMSEATDIGNIPKNASRYGYTIDQYPEMKMDIDRMIVFDYIFNNSDRHWGNFGIIIDKNNNKRMAPLFDHGYCLYGSEGNSDLRESVRRYDLYFEPSASFRSKQSDNLNLVRDIPSLNLDFSKPAEYYHKFLDEYKDFFIKERNYLMKTLFDRRYNHVRELCGYV